MKDTIKFIALAIIAITLSRPASAAADSWQERLLFDPSPAQLQMEQTRQRIMIYEGLTDTQVAQAMDRQFDRIEHMMFVGTIVTDSHGETVVDPETGAAMIEDDGC